MTRALDRELKTYDRELPKLLANSEGKFVLISGESVEGVFDSYQDAVAIGYEKHGVKPFLVKKIAASEQIAYFTRDIASCHS